MLTAGFGSRLHPLTHFLPKPLLPIGPGPLVGSTLEGLAKLGCELAVLNLHHLGEQFPESLGQSWFGLPLVYSWEEPIQGTLGALAGPRELLRDADAVILVNGDSLCDWPLKKLLRRHFKSGADATLLLHHRSPDSQLGGGVALGSDGFVVQLRDSEPVGEVARRHVFAGVHVLSPKLLEGIASEPGDIIEGLYIPRLADGGRIAGMVTRRQWQDLGTPDRYLGAVLDRLRSPWPLRRKHSWISPLARIDEGAEIRHSIVGPGVVVRSECRVRGSVLLADSKLGPRCEVDGGILGPGVELPAATRVEKRMVNRLSTHHPPGKDETVLGDLSYVPLSPVG